MKTETYIRKPFTAEAVRVTRENVNEIAEWCGGEVRIWKGRKGIEKPYVKVNVKHPLGVRQTEGRLGDWVLYANDGFKVYTDKAFRRTYEPVFQDGPPGAIPAATSIGQASLQDDCGS